MKITVNQLDEKNTDLVVQELKKENKQLHQFVNKYQKSKTANRLSVSCQTEEVGFGYRYIIGMHVHTKMCVLCTGMHAFLYVVVTDYRKHLVCN